MQPYTSVKFSIVTIMMAYIIKLNQLSSYIQALVLVCYILMVFLCPSNDLSFMYSMAVEKCLLDTAVSGYMLWPEECGRVEQRITGWLPPQLLHTWLYRHSG